MSLARDIRQPNFACRQSNFKTFSIGRVRFTRFPYLRLDNYTLTKWFAVFSKNIWFLFIWFPWFSVHIQQLFFSFLLSTQDFSLWLIPHFQKIFSRCNTFWSMEISAVVDGWCWYFSQCWLFEIVYGCRRNLYWYYWST